LRKIRALLPQKKERTSTIRKGVRTQIGKCRLLEGAKFITVGNYSQIREGAWLGAFPNQLPPTSTTNQTAARVPQLEIGDRVYIGFYACITIVDRLTVQEGAVISDYFYASDHTHGHDPRLGSVAGQPLVSKGPVSIGRNCFIGYRVTIMPGVSLGESCVVGAHSVVTKSFPAHTMVAGIPARVIKRFDLNVGAWLPAQDEK
jgi:acetyltransferase-like isoleucine patch superfamily enzyme